MAALPPFAVKNELNTQLSPLEEFQFRDWVKQKRVPFNPEAGVTDYDMRGYYRAMQQGHPVARSSIDPHDGQMHYPDYWKTPLHQTFSSESQWGSQSDPQWVNDAQLATPDGRIKFDARKQNDSFTGGLEQELRAILGK